jgi:hypothetical protein
MVAPSRLVDSAACFPRRGSLPVRHGSPARQEKPQSAKPTRRYKYTPNLPDGPLALFKWFPFLTSRFTRLSPADAGSKSRRPDLL